MQFAKLKGGATLAADLMVVGLGVAPVTAMLQGVAPRKDGGVDTDARLGIADGLYAGRRRRRLSVRQHGPLASGVEHWRVAMQQGRVAALNMLGREAMFDAVPYFWTIHFMKRLDYVGHAESWDEVAVDGDLEKPEFTSLLRQGRAGAGGRRAGEGTRRWRGRSG